jgi:hypothetical protein
MRGFEIRTNDGLFFTNSADVAGRAYANGATVRPCKVRKLANGTFTRTYS